MIRKICFCVITATLCVIVSMILHLIGFEELGIYCTISGAIFTIVAWFWIIIWIREI